MGAIALVVSAIIFLISRTKASKSEQIETSKDCWADIIEKYNEIEKKGPHPDRLWPALAAIDYFAYFILIRWIKDKEVLGYYKRVLTELIKNVLSKYGPSQQRSSWRDWYPDLDKLISKWNIDVPD